MKKIVLVKLFPVCWGVDTTYLVNFMQTWTSVLGLQVIGVDRVVNEKFVVSVLVATEDPHMLFNELRSKIKGRDFQLDSSINPQYHKWANQYKELADKVTSC